MNVQVERDVTAARRRIPFERVVLVLQGGGALGAYQAGVYEALAEAGINPDWIAGVSVGAINGAIIAGNPPNSRIDRMREFWAQVTAGGLWPCFDDLRLNVARGDTARNIFNQISAGIAMASGAKGFFTARPMGPWLQPAGTIEATSFYDTGDLKHTLERLVDFDRLNGGATRFSAGAVNVRTGNFVYFDTTTHTIRPEHVMASGALPPGLPAIEIEGEHYWDGGYMGNPAIFPLIYGCESSDVVSVHINPLERPELPRTASEILNRINEISFNSSLMREMRAINFVTKLIDDGKVNGDGLRRLLVHSIAADEVMVKLGVSSKMNADWEFLLHLHEAGRSYTEAWIAANFDRLGRESTTDIRAQYL